MYYFLLIYLSILTLNISQSKHIPTTTALKSCQCWEDYRAEISDTEMQCVAIDQFHIMPCNMPKLPKCHCSGGVSNILKDETGTWCTKYSKGEELRRWPCENVKEWDEFLKKNPSLIMDQYAICNQIKPPKCLCSGELTSVAKDHSGIWCIKYDKYLQENRWQCENSMEWDYFKRKHPYYLYC